MRSLERGFTLIELIVAFAVLSTVAAIGVPPLLDASGDLRVRMAAEEMVAALRRARWYAIRHDANVGVKFRQTGGFLTYSLYRDGDGDGVLSADIASGVDAQVQAPHRLASGAGVGFGFPPGRPARDPGDPGRFLKPVDPIRFNQSDLASYSPLGGATPGSLYLTDGQKRLVVVRVLGRTGRVRVLSYNFKKELWR